MVAGAVISYVLFFMPRSTEQSQLDGQTELVDEELIFASAPVNMSYADLNLENNDIVNASQAFKAMENDSMVEPTATAKESAATFRQPMQAMASTATVNQLRTSPY